MAAATNQNLVGEISEHPVQWYHKFMHEHNPEQVRVWRCVTCPGGGATTVSLTSLPHTQIKDVMHALSHDICNMVIDLREVARGFLDDMVSALPEHLSMIHGCLKQTELTK